MVPVDTDVAVSDEVAVATIWSLRQVANRVLNWSQYRIGRLLQTLVTNDGSPRAEVLARVSNTAQQAELSLRQSIARECAADSCALCTTTTRHEDEGQSGTTPYPCEVMHATGTQGTMGNTGSWELQEPREPWEPKEPREPRETWEPGKYRNLRNSRNQGNHGNLGTIVTQGTMGNTGT